MIINTSQHAFAAKLKTILIPTIDMLLIVDTCTNHRYTAILTVHVKKMGSTVIMEG